MQTQNVKLREYYYLWLQYTQDFPKSERKPFLLLLWRRLQGSTSLLWFVQDGLPVAYAINQQLPGCPYILLDYFAVIRAHRNQAYGSAALLTLGASLPHLHGVLFEIEAPGYGKDEADNANRRRRLNFYTKNGCLPVELQTFAFGVRMDIMVLPVNNAVPLSPEQAWIL